MLKTLRAHSEHDSRLTTALAGGLLTTFMITGVINTIQLETAPPATGFKGGVAAASFNSHSAPVIPQTLTARPVQANAHSPAVQHAKPVFGS